MTFVETICYCDAIQNKIFGCDKGGLVSKKGFWKILKIKLSSLGDFPGGPVVKNLPSNAGDVGTGTPYTEGQASLHALAKTQGRLPPLPPGKKGIA